MDYHKFDQVPARIQVAGRVASRYDDYCRQGVLSAGGRPELWESRRSGVDVVRTDDGRQVKLQSSAQQSPPQEGWILVIRGGGVERGYEWTLHGFAPAAGSDPS